MSATAGYPAGKLVSNQIIRLYCEESLSLSEVSARLHVKRGDVERVITQAGCMRSKGEGLRLVKLGRSRPNFSHPTHPGEGPVDNWKIVELKASRKSNKEIAKQLKRSQPSIFWALRRMGFPDGTQVTVCYSFGEVFDKLALRRLHEISGLNATDFAKQLGLPYATLWNGLRGKKQIHFNAARRIAEWRSRLLRRLMSDACRNPGWQTGKYSQSRVILTLFPNLRQRYSLLLEVLHRLAKKLRDNPEWPLDELQQYLCEEARGEKAGRTPGDLFKRFLPWAPELMPFLAGKLQDLRGVHHSPLAWKIIAGSLGTTAPIISEVINPAQARNIRPIPPEQMRWLILSWNKQPQPEAPKATKAVRGRRRKDDEAKRISELKARLSWAELTTTMNHEARLRGEEEKTEEAYRSLYRSRKKSPRPLVKIPA